MNFLNNLGWKNHQNESCRFCKVMKLCSWQLFDLKSSYHVKLCLNFKIRIFQTTSDGKTTKIKVVGLEKLRKFVVDNYFIWHHLVMLKYVWSFQIWNSNFVNDLRWRNYQNKSCRSRKVMRLCSWQRFHLNSFSTSNNQFTLGCL